MSFSDNSSLYYEYPLKMKLSDWKGDDNQDVEVMLCAYIVDVSGRCPFLQFLLINNGCNVLSLPKTSFLSSTNAIPSVKLFLSGLLEIDDWQEFDRQLVVDGVFVWNDCHVMFVDLTNCINLIGTDDTFQSSNVRFALVDEIVNHQRVCNIPVDDKISLFFALNEEVNFLVDERGEPFELPVVAFVGKETEKKASFVRIFGESAIRKTAMLGPYFYFTSFDNALKVGEAIVRFALFLGMTKIIENLPNDPIDDSDIKLQRLQEKDHAVWEKFTLRMSDYDGLWAQSFDSVVLPQLDTCLTEAPLLVVKRYEQQVPLSRHLVKSNKLAIK